MSQKIYTHEDVLKTLNGYFKSNIFCFKKPDYETPLPTIHIVLVNDKFVREDIFSFKDGFREELLDVLDTLGIYDVDFNNTGHTFWWKPL